MKIPVSTLQEAIIAECALYDKEMVMHPREREHIIAEVHARKPGAKVVSANLDIENGIWEVEIR